MPVRAGPRPAGFTGRPEQLDAAGQEGRGIEEERVGFHAYKRAGVRTTEFGKFRDKLAEQLTGTTIETLREVYDDVSYEELAEAMEMLRKARRRA